MPQQDEADIRQPVSDDAQPEFAAADSDAAAEAGPDVIILIESEAQDEADIRQPVSDDAQPEFAAAEAGPDVIILIEDKAQDEPQDADAQAEAADAVGMAEGEAAAAPAEPAAPRKEPRRFSRAERDALDRQQRRFAACGRCSYFVADCRVKLGGEAYQTAVLDSRDGWVRLEGDHGIHRMAMGAYGVELDAEFDLFDGSCPECRRRFVIVNEDDGRTRLMIQT